MLAHLIRKEILDSLLNQRFLALAVFSIVLMPFSAYINYEYFQERRASFDSQFAEYQEEERRSWDMRAYRPPELLSTLAQGTEAFMPLYFHLQRDANGVQPGNIEAQDFTTLSTFGSFDLLFLVQVVFSLLAVLLAFDMIAGEKERGTLKAVLANRVPRDSVLLGKFIGGFLVLWLTFLIGFMLLALVLVVADGRFVQGDMLVRLALIFGLSTLFLAAFYSLGLMISAFCHSTRTAIVVLLVVWVLVQLVIPKAGEVVAAVVVPARTDAAVRMEKAAIVDELDEELQTRAGELFTRVTGWTSMRQDGRSAFDLLGSDEPEAIAFREQYQVLAGEYQQQTRDRVREIDAAYAREKARQEQVSKTIALFSPASALAFLVTDAAATGDLAYRAYRDDVQAYYQLIDRDLFSRERAEQYRVRLPTGGSFSSRFGGDEEIPSAEDMPAFTTEAPSLGRVLTGNAWALGTLLGYLIVPFLVAYVAFLRYDVR